MCAVTLTGRSPSNSFDISQPVWYPRARRKLAEIHQGDACRHARSRQLEARVSHTYRDRLLRIGVQLATLSSTRAPAFKRPSSMESNFCLAER